MNFLFRLAGAIVYRVVREYREIEDKIETSVEHITIGLANGDEYMFELSRDSDGGDEPQDLGFGFRPTM